MSKVCKFKPLNTGIAHLNITTFNIRSLSAPTGGSSNSTRDRHRKVIQAITDLLKVSPALMLQETNLSVYNRTLEDNFPDYKIFTNSVKKGTAGTAVLLHNSILDIYHTKHTILVKGRAQQITLSPRVHDPPGNGANHRDRIELINVYIPSPSDRGGIFKKLLKLPGGSDNKYIIGGDFNFVEEREDAPSDTSSVILDKGTRTTWETILLRLHLREIRQGTHTHYSLHKDHTHSTTSRIDRIYITANDTDINIIRPITYIPHTLYSPAALAPGEKAISDHLPVSLRYLGTPAKSKSPHQRCIPKWIAEDKEIVEEIALKWKHNAKKDPYEAIQAFCNTVRRAVSTIFKKGKRREAAALDTHQRLTDSVKLYKMLRHANPKADYLESYLSAHPHLKPLNNSSLSNIENAKTVHENITQLQSALDSEGTDNPHLIVSDLPPSSKPPTKSGKNLLSSLADSLPCSRSRLFALRESNTSNPTKDPKRMSALLEEYWGGIWALRNKAPDSNHRNRYLKRYTKKISRANRPTIPSEDDMRDYINGSGNSSPGPDGIPFSIVRAFSHLLAPILHKILLLLAEGRKPPQWFNQGKLIFIPKKDTMLASDTRPITISNTVYRILSKAITSTITPCLQGLLCPEQKGFIPGRDGRDHVHDLTNKFYYSMENNEEKFLLFLDTRKAFDSIDHKFLLKVLKKIKIGKWVRNVVAGLLHKVVATPDLEGAQPIPIERGVKQGCPLSPLLFVLAYDVLLQYIKDTRTTEEVSPHGFADDLAVISPNITGIINVLSQIKTFSANSGLGVNWDKSSILPTKPLSPRAKGLLSLSGFGEIQITSRALYLGVLIGTDVTTVDIFQAAVDKFTSRVYKYRSALLARSLHHRILIFNIFLNPIMYYLSQFYILPNIQAALPLKRLAHRHIVPYAGKGMAYAHLIAQPPDLGPRVPYVDIWAWNLALLAQDYPFRKSHGKRTPWVPRGQEMTLDISDWDSLQTREHKTHAAVLHLTYGVDWDSEGLIDVTKLPKTPNKIRAWIYSDLVREAGDFKDARHNFKKPTCLTHKVLKHFEGLRSWPAPTVQEWTRYIADHTRTRNIIRPSIWNTYLRFFMRALPYGRRTRFFIGGFDQDNPTPCRLCGRGEDSHSHTFKHCEVMKSAFVKVAEASGLSNTARVYSLSSLLLLYPQTSPTHTITIITFVWSVWKARTDAPFDTHASAITCITNRTLITLLEQGTRIASSRSQDQINNLAISQPPRSLAIFTDGSSLEGQAKCGAGLHIAHLGESPDSPPLHANISIALGENDNNFGEMAALFVAAMIASVHQLHYPEDHVLIFTDSLLSVGYINHTWPSPTQKNLSQTTRKLFDGPLKEGNTKLYWIKGHSGLLGNDLADKEAKDGARRCNDIRKPPILVHQDHSSNHKDRLKHFTTGLEDWISSSLKHFCRFLRPRS